MEWQPIETAPENTEILCYCSDFEPHIFVGSYTRRKYEEERLVSTRGTKRIYELVTIEERVWCVDTPSWGATHWMPLPDPPAPEVSP